MIRMKDLLLKAPGPLQKGQLIVEIYQILSLSHIGLNIEFSCSDDFYQLSIDQDIKPKYDWIANPEFNLLFRVLRKGPVQSIIVYDDICYVMVGFGAENKQRFMRCERVELQDETEEWVKDRIAQALSGYNDEIKQVKSS